MSSYRQPDYPGVILKLFMPPPRLPSGMRVIQRWKQRKNSAQTAVTRIAMALAFVSAGALAVGAVTVGALAIGRLAVGRFVLKSGEIDLLLINELQVNSLRVKEKTIEKAVG
jgi:hypothetical protein